VNVFRTVNPDAYTTQDGVEIKSCWKLNKLGVTTISKTKQAEWEARIETLKQQIQYWIDNSTDKTIEIVELFY
jgi:Holliday junction resolvasome RuvABC endonuclease subunit